MSMTSPFSHATVDQVRDYWNRRPCNLRHSPEPVGTRAYFDQVRQRKYLVEPHIPRFAEFERWQGKRVLEIGCGIGTDTMSFAAAGARVTAVDLSEKSLELARKRAEVYGYHNRVEFFHANAEELSATVPVHAYDLVYSFGVIHHTPHPEKVLRQIRQYVRPGSELRIMLYHRHATKVLNILLQEGRGQFWKLNELIARHSEAQTGCPVTYSYTRREARKLLESEGYHVQDVSVDHIFPYRVPDYVQYRYVMAWYYRVLPAPVFRALERTFGWHLCLKAQA